MTRPEAANAGRVVAVTGATAGIGLGIARQFAAAGHRVVGSARRVEHGREVEAELRAAGFDFTFVPADVTTAAGCRRFIDAVLDTHGAVDVLVNNAGTVGPDPLVGIGDVTEAQYDQLLDTNLKSMFFTSQAVVAPMTARGGGTIFNLGSAAGEVVAASMALYRTSKSAAMFMSQCLAEALAVHGIRVHTLVVHRVASDGGERTLQARIDQGALDGDQAERLRRDYAATAASADDFGAGLVKLLDHPTMTLGPGFVVRR